MGKRTKVLECYVDFDDSAPTGFLIRNTRDDRTVLVQTDWDYPGVARSLGWTTCCGATDGTIDCRAHGRTATEMIASAYDWIQEHEGEEFVFEDPGYFEDEEVSDEERSYGPRR